MLLDCYVSVGHILLPTPACQQLLPQGSLSLAHWHPKRAEEQLEALTLVHIGTRVSEEAPVRSLTPPTPTVSDLEQGKSGSLGPDTNDLFFYKEQSTKRWGAAQGLGAAVGRLRALAEAPEALVAFPGVKRRPRQGQSGVSSVTEEREQVRRKPMAAEPWLLRKSHEARLHGRAATVRAVPCPVVLQAPWEAKGSIHPPSLSFHPGPGPLSPLPFPLQGQGRCQGKGMAPGPCLRRCLPKRWPRRGALPAV